MSILISFSPYDVCVLICFSHRVYIDLFLTVCALEVKNMYKQHKNDYTGYMHLPTPMSRYYNCVSQIP